MITPEGLHSRGPMTPSNQEGMHKGKLPVVSLTNSKAKGIEGVPVDSVQLAHQGHAEFHQDTDVHMLPL